MKTRQLLDLAARLFAKHGPNAEVYAPVILTADAVLEEIDREATPEAVNVVDAVLRTQAIDAPDHIYEAAETIVGDVHWRSRSALRPLDEAASPPANTPKTIVWGAAPASDIR